MPPKPPLPALDSDYDGAWKEILTDYLKLTLACYFPAVHAGIDWTHEPVSLDQELNTLLATERSQVRRVDKLARVRLKEGGTACLLIHLEVQSFQEADFARRLRHYHYGIQSKHQDEDVISLVVLADLSPSWHPREYRSERFGFVSLIQFPTCKLLDLLPSLENDLSIPALAAKAQIAALRSSRDPEKRYLARWKLVRSLYDHGFSRDEVVRAYRVLSWMMRLPEEMTLKFREELIEFEKEKNMPYEIDTQVLARQEGRQEGRREGAVNTILAVLTRHMGPVDEDLRRQIMNLSPELQDSFTEAALDFHSISEVRDWLQRHA